MPSRRQLVKWVVIPLTRCIEKHSKENREGAAKISKNVQSLEDSIDILARELMR